VVRLRTGIVLFGGGGLLGPVLPLFRLGLGGRLGGGAQYLSWIALADWLAAVRFVLGAADLTGPINLVGPRPVTNAEFTGVLGRQLHRPTVVRVPGPPLRLVLRGFAAELLDSRRVLPRVLTDAGFEFRHPTVADALAEAVRATLSG
jgi:uncharacterized protein (TIGR01777 family)